MVCTDSADPVFRGRRGPSDPPPQCAVEVRPTTMAPMDLPDPFREHEQHIAADLPGGTVLFSTRRGGVSEGPFASLNLGRLTDDSDANVDANRERLAAATGHPRERFAYGRQVHGTSVRRATEPPGPAAAGGRGGRAGDRARRRRGARVHRRLPAGDARRRRRRRGAARRLARARRAGSSPRASQALRDLGADGAGHRRARPGGARAAATRSARRSTRTSRATTRGSASATSTSRRSRAAQLEAAGVQQIHDVGLCTMCADPDLFFSHRRDNGVTGRQAGVVWRA